MPLDTTFLISRFEETGAALAERIRTHPRLAGLFLPTLPVDAEALKQAYADLLRMHRDYARYAVPALRAAADALATGGPEDRAWSERLRGHAVEETDGDDGHDTWAESDMRALGVPPERLRLPALPSAGYYGRYFVGGAGDHPYAILGAKGVLEHLSLHAGDAIADAVRGSAIPHGADAVTFFSAHGALDIEHVREGDAGIRSLDGRRDTALEEVYRGVVMTGYFYALMLEEYLA